MAWRIIGTAGCALSLALVVANAWIRHQEHTVGVRPSVRYPLAWLSLLLLPIGVMAGIIGVVIAESIKEEPVLILGLALVFTGLSGILAMEVGDNWGRRGAQPRITKTFLGMLFLLSMAGWSWLKLALE